MPAAKLVDWWTPKAEGAVGGGSVPQFNQHGQSSKKKS